ncbi:MAG: hypothetical protein ACRD8W_12545 [Nitrososphaeraceae archaeon]
MDTRLAELVVVAGIISLVFGFITLLAGEVTTIPYIWRIIMIVIGSLIIIFVPFRASIFARWPIMLRKNCQKMIQDELKSYQPQCYLEALSRNELTKTSELISRAISEICFLGLTLETLRQATESIENGLRRNVDVRVLLLDRKSDLPTRMERVVVTSNIDQDIDRTIDALSLRDADPPLKPEQKRRLRVKEHREIPSYSMILIDPGLDGSRYIHVEPYPFGISSEKRKIFVLSTNAAKQKELAELYYNAFNNLWDSEESNTII